MGQRDMDNNRKVAKKIEAPLRRSARLQKPQKHVRPSPGLLAAKLKAQSKMGAKQTVFSFVPDIYQVARESKHQVRGPTGVIYDTKMLEHQCLWDQYYPECPERLNCVLRRCSDMELLDRCQVLESCQATEAQILALHCTESLETLKSTQGSSDIPNLETLSSKYDSIFIHPSSYDCSLLSVGSAIKLAEDVYRQKIQNGAAFIRPPGHHAMKGEYCGYCFFNNVALAANHVLSLGAKKVLIVDWDVHHGQGTQQMFYSDPRVVYFSIHRYENGTFWPNLRESDFDYTGEGPGLGYNFNIPLNTTGMTDADYMAVFHQILLPMAYEFGPEIVLVSAGYDAALGCPEFRPDIVLVSAGYDSALGDEKGEMKLTPAVYAHFVSCLTSLANGRVAVFLEGGYCLKSLSEGAALTLRALLGDPAPNIGSLGPPCPSMQETIQNVIYSHRETWNCFKTQNMYSIYEPPGEDEVRHMPVLNYECKEQRLETYPTRDCYPVQSAEFVKKMDSVLDHIILATKLLSPQHKVSFVYDVQMMEHINYEDKDHIEKPARIASIYKMHEEYELLGRVHVLKSRYATDEELEAAHSRDHVEAIKNLATLKKSDLIGKKDDYHSVYFHQNTYKAASLASGCLLQVVDSVLQGESATGVAIVRPPGHHADTDDPSGFCIFNNISVAAKYAISKYKLQRVLIIDWDVHHGNGTQEIFFQDPNVLYISIHRYDNGDFFPFGEGSSWHIGKANGTGFTVNVPWNKNNMGDGEYVAAFFKVILPIAYQFDPELVLVSAGFDAARGDPLGGCKVSPEAFGHFTNWLLPLANGRIILSLEGGYNINSISYAMTMCTKALLGDPIPPLEEGLRPCPSAVESINETITAHKQHWTTLCHYKSLPVEDVLLNPPKNPLSATPRNESQSANHSKNVRTLVDEGQELMKSLSLYEGDPIPVSEGNEDGNKRSDSGGGGNPPDESPSTSSLATGAAKVPTLTDFLCENIHALVNEEMYAVVPLKSCPHLPEVRPIPDTGIDVNLPCRTCSSTSENWTCLICYAVECGRYVNEHMMQHNNETGHPLTLSFSDLSVWCYPCQAYIDNQLLYNARNAAHISKFGVELPWSYQKKE